MKKITKKIIKTISKFDIEDYKKERLFNDIIKNNFLGKYSFIDTRILVKNHTVGIRMFLPDKETNNLIIYFHGGGFVCGSVNNYTKTCYILAKNTNATVISVDYRLAPEYPFPNGLEDCYEVTKYFFSKDSFLTNKNIILMGDSAGGNIASVVSIIASEKKEFKIEKQILLYPLTYHIHDDNSHFESVKENGNNWILTNKRINNYLDLYVTDKSKLNSKYVTPLNAETLENQPKTLIITAEFDPLRDEGEAYGKKLQEFKNEVKIYRIKDVIHGFFTYFPNSKENKKCYKLINDFIGDDKL